MARRGVKKRDYERLDDSTIGRVVSLLEQEKPVTKKVACEILNISYNTTRLSNIIQEYKENIKHIKKRKAALKGKPFSNLELKEMTVSYLSGESITSIAAELFRSVGSVKLKLKELHLPERDSKSTYHNPGLMSDEMVSEDFQPGELVWASRYNSVAEIKSVYEGYADFKCYSIWVFGKHNEWAYQPYWELGKLNVLKQFNLREDEFINTEKPNFNYRIE